MRIVFFGSPNVALPSLGRLLESGHSIELVISQPDKPAGRGRKLKPSPVKTFALEHRLPVLTPEKIKRDEAILEKLAAIQPDIHVIVAYGQIIPGSIIYLPRYHSLNVHFSLLPKYRGASPVQWAILNGEEKTGVTIIELNEKMDEGDILSTKETDILPGETFRELETRLAYLGADLLVTTLHEIDRIQPVPQNQALATLAPKIRKDDGRIDWTHEAGLIDRKVRAFNPWPSAFTSLKGRRINIRRGREIHSSSRQSSPGEILAMDKGGLEVACGGGSLYRVECLQPEGKKDMDAFAFSLGADIRPGEKFQD